MERQVFTEQIERAVADLDSASSASEVFRKLLETSRLGAPRAAIFLIRQNQAKGWGSTGYGPEPSRRLQKFQAPATEGWLGRLAAENAARALQPGPGEAAADFGQPLADETVGFPVRVAGRTLAILTAERATGESPWEPGLLGILVTVARARLEVDLVHRRMQGKPSGERPRAAPTSPAPPAPAAGPAAEPAPVARKPGPEEATGLAPAPERAPAAASGQVDAPSDVEHAPARRYARLIATDIRLYNEEAVLLGRQHGDLAQRLGEHLNRGRETFLRRYSSLGPDALAILHEAYIQVLAAGDEDLLPTPGKY